LRELRADGNRITSIDGLQKLEALNKLNLHSNQIQQVDFSNVRWYESRSATHIFIDDGCVYRPHLEMLNLSGNRLTGTLNLASSLPGLVGLNIGEFISTLSLGALDDDRTSMQIITRWIILDLVA
jgi:protein NUD1